MYDEGLCWLKCKWCGFGWFCVVCCWKARLVGRQVFWYIGRKVGIFGGRGGGGGEIEIEFIFNRHLLC